MTEWTPSTEEIRQVYKWSGFDGGGRDEEYPDRLNASNLAEFDRWLNGIRAEAWDEGFTLATRNNPNHPHHMAKMNPYRTED